MTDFGSLTSSEKQILHILLQKDEISRPLFQGQQHRADELKRQIERNDSLIATQEELLTQLRELENQAKLSRAIPAQVLLSAHVTLEDAYGRMACFNLEWITSAKVCLLGSLS